MEAKKEGHSIITQEEKSKIIQKKNAKQKKTQQQIKTNTCNT